MVSIKDMSLSKKLIGSFALVVVLLGIIGFTGYSSTTTINSNLNFITQDLFVSSGAFKDMQAANLAASEALGEHILGIDDAKVQLEASYKKFDAAVIVLQGIDMDDGEKQRLAEIVWLHGDFKQSLQQVWDTTTAASSTQNANEVAAIAKYIGIWTAIPGNPYNDRELEGGTWQGTGISHERSINCPGAFSIK